YVLKNFLRAGIPARDDRKYRGEVSPLSVLFVLHSHFLLIRCDIRLSCQNKKEIAQAIYEDHDVRIHGLLCFQSHQATFCPAAD
ncbi:hypothetical protein WFJ45_23130, partial [Salmonella enterica subsp. enterica serovar Minnesota]